MSKISVILPCYNVENYLDRCLGSIVRQTFGRENLEIICVDDASTDGTVQKLLEWEKRYPEQFLVVQCETNGRQGRARNIGLQYAQCDWIAFLDSDDWIEEDYFERLYGAAASGKYEVVCCGYVRDRGALEPEAAGRGKEGAGREYFVRNDEERKPLLLQPPLGYSAWAKLIARKFLWDNELFFPENLTYEDACWGSLLHLYMTAAYVMEDKLHHYRVNDSSTVLTRNSNHHLDCLTTQSMLWDEWERRGFLERYPEELEMETLYSAYLPGLKAAILRYEEPDYNVYLLLRYLIIRRIPDYESNSYIRAGILPEYYELILQSLKTQLDRREFLELAGYVKKIGL